MRTDLLLRHCNCIHHRMPSSVVAHFTYNAGTHILRVYFISGAVYDYLKIPENTFLEMKEAASKGEYLNTHIKPVYKYKKVR